MLRKILDKGEITSAKQLSRWTTTEWKKYKTHKIISLWHQWTWLESNAQHPLIVMGEEEKWDAPQYPILQWGIHSFHYQTIQWHKENWEQNFEGSHKSFSGRQKKIDEHQIQYTYRKIQYPTVAIMFSSLMICQQLHMHVGFDPMT